MMQSFVQHVSSKKHLIFDFDGTLVDLEMSWQAVWEPKIREILSTYHKKDVENVNWTDINSSVSRHGEPLLQELRRFQEEFEDNYIHGYSPNSDLIDWIQTHQNEYQFSLWTSQARKTVEKILPQVGLGQIFSTLVTRNEVIYVKPDPNGFFLIQHREPLSDFVMIGDAAADEQAAKAAGIDFFQVSMS